MNRQSVSFSLDLQDYRALSAYLSAPKTARWALGPRLLGVGGALVIALLARLYAESFSSFCFGILSFALPVLLGIKFVVARTRKRLEPLSGGSVLCQRELTLTPEGIELRSQNAHSLTRWAGVIAVDETPQHVFLRTDSVAAYTVPKRAFSSELLRREFVSAANQYRSLPAQPKAE